MAPDADLTPPGVAQLIAEFLEALDLTDVTIVANDTGGALTQLLMATHPERLGRVVLTPCDAFEAFFPEPFTALPRRVRLPGAASVLSRALQLSVVQRRPSTYGWLSKEGIPAEARLVTVADSCTFVSEDQPGRAGRADRRLRLTECQLA